eukprot:Pgem_evm1s12690
MKQFQVFNMVNRCHFQENGKKCGESKELISIPKPNKHYKKLYNKTENEILLWRSK